MKTTTKHNYKDFAIIIVSKYVGRHCSHTVSLLNPKMYMRLKPENGDKEAGGKFITGKTVRSDKIQRSIFKNDHEDAIIIEHPVSPQQEEFEVKNVEITILMDERKKTEEQCLKYAKRYIDKNFY